MTSDGTLEVGDKVWYFAYGSNMKSSVMERRGMKPFAAKKLVVPSHVLTFDIFGVPYTEPAMASIAERDTAGQAGRGKESPPPPVHGIGYLLSAGDFKNLVVSEGAGTAYTEVELDARVLDDDQSDALPVRTLVGRYPFRPNPLPSARYLGLLIDGAEEHDLPVSYRYYLASLPSYTKSLSPVEAFGARVFLGLWMPIITWTMKRIKTAARHTESGRSDSRAGVFVWLLFNAHPKKTIITTSFSFVILSLRVWSFVHRIIEAMEDPSPRARALKLLEQVPLIDGHNDFAYMVRGWFRNNLSQPDFDIHAMPIGQTDISRLHKGKLGGQFWSAFVPCPKDGDSKDTILLSTLQQVDLLHGIFEQYSSIFTFVAQSSDIFPAFKAGKLVSLLGIEGLHQIGGSPSVLRMLYKLGVRYATLCHNKGNEFSDSATAEDVHGGLSKMGRKVVQEMNRIGMIVDLAHTSHKAQLDALKYSEAPVIFSHSSCYELCPNPRNVRNEVLHKLKANRGLIMICFIPSLVTPPQAGQNGSVGDRGAPSVASVVDHIVYVGETIGYAHVGIGSDFDGMLEGPPDLDDTSCFPSIIEELIRRGVDEDDVKLVMGLNVIRIMEEVESVSRVAQNIDKWDVLCDDIASPWTDEQVSLLVARGSLRNTNGSSGLH
ncbi:cytochrome P450 monooxygenase monooxygenase [Purpureocillium lavendulum]|uniref:Dipeptidase n=1 Tax=Purpureocillium lavendulum TaxID=1247861 RepID=A0AB34G258_9HYPO|nr:cytochrome P450 monooxygenase monooxygenase [Purpureocillium lavendulum]